jgi:hypothetical protein
MRSTAADPSPARSAGDDQIATLRAEVADLRARLDSYERILQLRDAALAATPAPQPLAPQPTPNTPPPPLPATFDIAADQLLPAQDGFYQLEWGPEGAFRWTGPAPDIGFDAWIDRQSPLVATLQLFHFGTPANARGLTIEVDGTAYALTRQGTDKVLRSDPIAPRAGDGPTRLTVTVPHLHSPAERGQADRRTLGVAFQRLRLEPA